MLNNNNPELTIINFPRLMGILEIGGAFKAEISN